MAHVRPRVNVSAASARTIRDTRAAGVQPRRAGRVPVELADRKEVQGRDEEAEPGRHEDRVLVHAGARVGRSPHDSLRQPHHQRIVEENGPGLRRTADRLCPGHAVEEEGERDEEAGQRTGGPDVDQRFLVPDRLLDADQGAERADEIEKRRRQEVRERRREAVTAAHDVMAELVGSEDEQEGIEKGRPSAKVPLPNMPRSRKSSRPRSWS